MLLPGTALVAVVGVLVLMALIMLVRRSSTAAPKEPPATRASGKEDGEQPSPGKEGARGSGTSPRAAADGWGSDGTPRGSAAQAAAQKEARRLRKKLRSLEELRTKRGSGARLDADQRAKLEALSSAESELLADLEATERVMAECEAAALARVERAREEERARERALEDTLKVSFDAAYACPVCQDVLEAATMVVGCRHVFCRACLEDVIARATVPAHCTCPLCRAPLFDNSAKKTLLRPARELRKRMAKRTGRCHCGAEVTLSQLRQHLCQCGPAGAHYRARRKFRHCYSSPSFADPEAEAARRFHTDDDWDQAVRLSLATYFSELRERGDEPGGAL